MLFATLSRRSSFRLLTLLVGLGSVASSCQSSRPTFSFQPVVLRTSVAAPAPRAAASVPAVAPATVAATPTLRPALPIEPAAAGKASPLPASAPQLAARPTELPATTGPAPGHPATRIRHHFLRRAQVPAEVGLGTTVFGILGLVTLPIALIGLLLSGGGLVWGIVAGAAALAILVAWLDPFGH